MEKYYKLGEYWKQKFKRYEAKKSKILTREPTFLMANFTCLVDAGGQDRTEIQLLLLKFFKLNW